MRFQTTNNRCKPYQSPVRSAKHTFGNMIDRLVIQISRQPKVWTVEFRCNSIIVNSSLFWLLLSIKTASKIIFFFIYAQWSFHIVIGATLIIQHSTIAEFSVKWISGLSGFFTFRNFSEISENAIDRFVLYMMTNYVRWNNIWNLFKTLGNTKDESTAMVKTDKISSKQWKNCLILSKEAKKFFRSPLLVPRPKDNFLSD